jgi:TnpA family transposase
LENLERKKEKKRMRKSENKIKTFLSIKNIDAYGKHGGREVAPYVPP